MQCLTCTNVLHTKTDQHLRKGWTERLVSYLILYLWSMVATTLNDFILTDRQTDRQTDRHCRCDRRFASLLACGTPILKPWWRPELSTNDGCADAATWSLASGVVSQNHCTIRVSFVMSKTSCSLHFLQQRRKRDYSSCVHVNNKHTSKQVRVTWLASGYHFT